LFPLPRSRPPATISFELLPLPFIGISLVRAASL
jgi:hypothetical protein